MVEFQFILSFLLKEKNPARYSFAKYLLFKAVLMIVYKPLRHEQKLSLPAKNLCTLRFFDIINSVCVHIHTLL